MIFTILDAWSRTSALDRLRGRTWYGLEREWCRRLARGFGYPLSTVCGVYSALSPNQSWRANRGAVILVLAGRCPMSNYGRDVRKARAILGGADPASTLNGPKTVSFYHLLLDGGNDYDVCVDGHVANMARGEVRPLKGIHLSLADYHEIATDVRLAASLEAERPCDLQATLWWAWRRDRGLRQRQLELEPMYVFPGDGPSY